MSKTSGFQSEPCKGVKDQPSQIDQWMSVFVSAEQGLADAKITYLMCLQLLTILTGQGYIGTLLVFSEVSKCASDVRFREICWAELKVALKSRLRIFWGQSGTVCMVILVIMVIRILTCQRNISKIFSWYLNLPGLCQ